MRPYLIAATCALLLSGPGCSAARTAKDEKPKEAPNTAKAVTPGPANVPADIRTALDEMANAMKAMTSFELRSDITSEEVLESGQKLQNAGQLTIEARRPDRLYVDMDSEQRKRRLYYDGKQVTVFGPATGFYASIAAPPTTRAMLDAMAARNGLETPLADLFEWGASGVNLDKITSAMYAGQDRIGGNVCEHYAFRQEGVDWQLWINTQGQPLPCKLVIVNTEDEAQPQSTMLFNWSPGRQIADSRFVFTAPAGAQRIAIAQAPQGNDEVARK